MKKLQLTTLQDHFFSQKPASSITQKMMFFIHINLGSVNTKLQNQICIATTIQRIYTGHNVANGANVYAYVILSTYIHVETFPIASPTASSFVNNKTVNL